ncbi:MAG: hypothetical protein KDK71_09395 [Chlamydiia bacterium]|nr:hypothetical protein [Chlamydiia bacterium]
MTAATKGQLSYDQAIEWVKNFDKNVALVNNQSFYSSRYTVITKKDSTEYHLNFDVKALLASNKVTFSCSGYNAKGSEKIFYLLTLESNHNYSGDTRLLTLIMKQGEKRSSLLDFNDVTIEQQVLQKTPIELFPDCPARDVKFLSPSNIGANKAWADQFERINFWRFTGSRTMITQDNVEYTVTARFEVVEKASPELTLHFETQNPNAKGFKLTFYNDKDPQAFDLQFYQTPKEGSEAQQDFAKGLAILKMIQDPPQTATSPHTKGAPKTSKGTSYPWAAITLVAIACLGLYYYRQPIAHFFGYSSPSVLDKK